MKDLIFKRPADGIEPNRLEFVIGRTLKRDMPADATLKWEDLV